MIYSQMSTSGSMINSVNHRTDREEVPAVAYELYCDHPETQTRQTEDFTSWTFWAKENAPWSGVSVTDVAELLKVICPRPDMEAVCARLDFGGTLTPEETREVLQRASGAMTDTVQHIFTAAVDGGYGVRVEFSRGPFGALSASEYMAKFGSAAEH